MSTRTKLTDTCFRYGDSFYSNDKYHPFFTQYATRSRLVAPRPRTHLAMAT